MCGLRMRIELAIYESRHGLFSLVRNYKGKTVTASDFQAELL